MENKKKVMFLLNQVRTKQKEVDDLLEKTMEVIGNVMKIDGLDQATKDKYREKAREIIDDFLSKHNNVLEEEEQRQLFIELKNVNYTKQGLAYVLRDTGFDIEYLKSSDPLCWKPMKVEYK